MSVILEKQLLSHILYNPETIEKVTLNGEHFSDVIVRCIYTKLREKHNETDGYEFINKDVLPLIYENNKEIFNSKDITTFKEIPKYIFSDYDKESSFDWMFSENIIKDEFKKRKYIEVLEKTIENLEISSIDSSMSNLDMGLRNLDKDNPRDSTILQASNFMGIYNERSKEIEEAKKSNKPTYYKPSHPIAQKYTRIKKGWFCNIISGTAGGKSLELVQEAVYHSKTYNERVLFITDENSDEVILTYMYCNYLGIKYHDVEDRIIDLNEYINNLNLEDKNELKRIFTNIDVIELAGIPTIEVRNILKTAENNDNSYGWVGLDSFEEVNIDANVEEVTRQNQNAILCERIAKDFKLILWVTAQLKTDFYPVSVEKMMMTCNHGSKTLIKKSFLSILLWWEYSKDEDGDKTLGFRGKLNKCRSGGVGKIYEIKQNYDYCQLIASENELGNDNYEVGF